MPHIMIVEYDPEWPDEFSVVANRLRQALGELALRIDHIGSTSVPNLAAKDIIDVQVTVASLDDPDIRLRLERAGAHRSKITTDHEPPGMAVAPPDLAKLLFFFSDTDRRSNIHLREAGHFNQVYPLLCRDYLRSHPNAAAAYAEIKRQLARHFNDDVEAYYDVKDPTFDLFMAAARDWADWVDWMPPPSDA